MPSSLQPNKPINPVRFIVVAWLIAGTLDISAAIIQYYIKTGNSPGRLLRYVASGFFGPSALADGTAMAAWGLFFHFLVAFIFTLFFFWIYPMISRFATNKFLTGMGYGLFVWLVMNLVVVPLSNAPAGPIVLKRAIVGILIIMFCIGLPISLVIGNYYSKKKP